jgi:hypothetical protein
MKLILPINGVDEKLPLNGERIITFSRFSCSEARYWHNKFVLASDIDIPIPEVTHWAPWPTISNLKE